MNMIKKLNHLLTSRSAVFQINQSSVVTCLQFCSDVLKHSALHLYADV